MAQLFLPYLSQILPEYLNPLDQEVATEKEREKREREFIYIYFIQNTYFKSPHK